MNENPGGTPNPLNPSSAGPAPAPAQPMAQSAPPANPTVPATSVTSTVPTTPVSTVPVESLAPVDRPMEKAAPAPESEKKKKKTGLIVSIIVAAVLLIGGGIAAAIVLMNMNKIDPVTAAMNKIMSGNAPANVAIDGDIDIAINDNTSPISNVKIALNSKLITSSAINDSVANVTATIRNVGNFSVEFDEVYAGNGDLYFKIDGATSAIEDSGILYLLNLANQMPGVVDCGEDEYCQSTEIKELTCAEGEDCKLTEIDDTKLNVLDGGQNVLDKDTIAYFASLVDVVEVIDGEWLKISVEELNMLSGGAVANSHVSCITNLVSDINTNSNSAIELYKKYPFVTSTNKDVQLASKRYPVYLISIDNKDFANYINSIQNSKMTDNLYSCLGWENNVKVSEDSVAKIANDMPEIYAEVDSDNNFTRLYIKSFIEEPSSCDCPEEQVCDCTPPAKTDITMDLGFSYPNNVNVPEPEEYRNFSDVIQEITSSMFNISGGTGGVTVETVDN